MRPSAVAALVLALFLAPQAAADPPVVAQLRIEAHETTAGIRSQDCTEYLTCYLPQAFSERRQFTFQSDALSVNASAGPGALCGSVGSGASGADSSSRRWASGSGSGACAAFNGTTLRIVSTHVRPGERPFADVHGTFHPSAYPAACEDGVQRIAGTVILRGHVGQHTVAMTGAMAGSFPC